MRWRLACLTLALSAAAGCGDFRAKQDGGGRAPLGGQVVPGGLDDLAQPAPSPAVGPGTTTLVPAEAGVGKQGRGYGGGIYTEPLRQRFRAEQTIIFDHVKHALNLYKGLNDGVGPQTHEEFMEQIIAANQIKLPELPPGERYLYDPQTEELMVERPAN
jgi:hypothetical protein